MKAFTIIEIIVVMIITSVVINSSLLLYSNMSKLQNSSFHKGEEEAALVLLTSVLRKDCHLAEVVRYRNNELLFVKGKSSVSYEFLPLQVIRKAEITDTFPFQTVNLQLAYADSSHQTVRSISFTLLEKNDSIPFYVYKEYSPEFFINQNSLKP
jgi:type II secretory pathway component PulJ